MALDDGNRHRSDREVDLSPLVHIKGRTPARLVVTVPRSNDASGVARDAMRRWLATWPSPGGLAAEVLLVLSELVTNAVIHAASTAYVTATLDHDRLRLEVHDRCFGPPRARNGGDGPGGYGLQFVATLADEWGWATTPTGTVVWTEDYRIETVAGEAPSPL
jgi:anti-sigma regulatory factor (Ser/Thr protein kinase)